MQAGPALRERVVLQRRGPVVRVHDVARVVVQSSDPLRELKRVGQRGGEKDHLASLRRVNDALLPHDASLFIPHVVHLVEDDPLDLSHDLAPAVQHPAQDFRRHHDARRVFVDAHVARHETHLRAGVAAKLLRELSELLVRQRLDRGGVYNPLLVPERHRDGVFRDDGLPRGRVRGDHHALVSLEDRDGGFLERVEDERVRLGARAVVRRVVQSVAVAVPALRDRDLVHARRPRRRRSHRRGVFGTFFLAAAADVVVSVVVVALALPRRLANRVRARV
eukprot:31477-Pelagococcus_subviridis.AAC.9